MASTNDAESLQGRHPSPSQGRQGGSQGVGLRQIGEHLTRAAQETQAAETAPDAALHLWRNATPVP